MLEIVAHPHIISGLWMVIYDETIVHIIFIFPCHMNQAKLLYLDLLSFAFMILPLFSISVTACR